MRFSSIILTLFYILLSGGYLSAAADRTKIRQGVEAYGEENWDAALGHFQDALLDDPENPQLHYNIGAVWYKKENYEESLNAFQKAVLTQSVDLQQNSYYNMGNVLSQMEKYQEAITAYKKALDLDPADVDAKHNLELVRARLKEMADKQQQQSDPRQEKIEPSEFAKQLKAQAERLVLQNLYRAAYDLMMQGLNQDETVRAYQTFIDRIKVVVDVEEAT